MPRLRIAICDDEPEQSAYLSKIVTGWADKRGHTAALTVFPSAEALLFEFEDSGGWDILLLEIQMPGMDGVTLAKRMRQYGGNTQIVFITGFSDWISEGYEVDALHYLMKPVSAEKLFQILDKAVARVKVTERVIAFAINGEILRVSADSIVYAEAFSHYSDIHTVNDILRVKMTITALETLLGDGFFRCHRSYIAGMKHVRAVTRTSLKLENGTELPLSRKLFGAASEAFVQYNWGGR